MFSFAMSKEQKMVKDEFAKFVKEMVIDAAHDMDEDGKIPDDVIQKVWELGASVSMIPEEYGGFGMKDSPVETCLILEELAYGDMSFAVAATLPSLFTHPVAEMGTDAQKKKYLPLLTAAFLSGKKTTRPLNGFLTMSGVMVMRLLLNTPGASMRRI